MGEKRKLVKTKAGIAKLLGVAKSTVTRWERDRVLPSPLNQFGWDPEVLEEWYALKKGDESLKRKMYGKATGRAAHGLKKKALPGDAPKGSGGRRPRSAGSSGDSMRGLGETSGNSSGSSSGRTRRAGRSSGRASGSIGESSTQSEGGMVAPSLAAEWEVEDLLDVVGLRSQAGVITDVPEKLKFWQAVSAEITVCRELKQLVPRSTMQEMGAEFVRLVKGALDQMPGRLARKCAGKGEKALEELARREVEGLMAQLAALGGG